MDKTIECLVSDALETISSKIERRLITRGGTKQPDLGGLDLDGIPYLYRAYVLPFGTKNEGCGAFLHKFVSSDKQGELHNHPWQWSVSYILAGSYVEWRPQVKYLPNGEICLLSQAAQSKYFTVGDVNVIGRHRFHRIELTTKEVWTLFIHGPRVGPWGFVPQKYGEPLKITEVTKRSGELRPEVGKRDG